MRALYAGAMAGLQIPVGRLALSINGRTILALGTALSALGYVFAGFSGEVFGLGIAPTLSGAGSSTQHPTASAAASRAPLGIYNFTGDLGGYSRHDLAAVARDVLAARVATRGCRRTARRGRHHPADAGRRGRRAEARCYRTWRCRSRRPSLAVLDRSSRHRGNRPHRACDNSTGVRACTTSRTRCCREFSAMMPRLRARPARAVFPRLTCAGSLAFKNRHHRLALLAPEFAHHRVKGRREQQTEPGHAEHAGKHRGTE
jgi:hypothetical protein